jgi:hypothetical protein
MSPGSFFSGRICAVLKKTARLCVAPLSDGAPGSTSRSQYGNESLDFIGGNYGFAVNRKRS